MKLYWFNDSYLYEYRLQYKENSEVYTLLADIKQGKRVCKYRIITDNIYFSNNQWFALKIPNKILGSTKSILEAKKIIESYYENQNKKTKT